MSPLDRGFEACTRASAPLLRQDVGPQRDAEGLGGVCAICLRPDAWHRDPITNQSLPCFDVTDVEARANFRLALRQSVRHRHPARTA